MRARCRETIHQPALSVWSHTRCPAGYARASRVTTHGRSRGLFTPSAPRSSTWRYVIVVRTSRWPSSSCTVRMSYAAAASASRNSGGAHPHTAHELSQAIIHYRHHPIHGEHVATMMSKTLDQLLKLPVQERVDVAIALWESITEAEREQELALTPELSNSGSRDRSAGRPAWPSASARIAAPSLDLEDASAVARRSRANIEP
jgi:hypothetical protein